MRFAMVFTGSILMAKSQLTVGEVGVIESFLFLSAAVSFFWVSGLTNVLLSRYPRLESDARRQELYACAFNLYMINFLLIIIGWMAGPVLKDYLPTEILPYYRLLLIYIFLNNPTFLTEHILLLTNRSLSLVAYGFIQFCAHLFAILIALLLNTGLEGIFINLILVAIIKNIFLFILLRRHSVAINGWRIPMEQLLNAIPITGGLLLAGSAEYIDGFLVSNYFGNDAFAIFRYGARELPLSLLLANSLSAAFVPKLAASGSATRDLGELRDEARGLMHLLFPVTILFIFISHSLYPVLFRPQFAESAEIFNVYLLLVASRLLFPQTLVYGHNLPRVIFAIALVELGVNIFASLTLMQFFGIKGIALGTLFAFMTEKLLLIQNRQKHPQRLKIVIRKKRWSP